MKRPSRRIVTRERAAVLFARMRESLAKVAKPAPVQTTFPL